MTDATANAFPGAASADKPRRSILVQDPGMRRRNAAETRFRFYGIAAILVSLSVLFVMLWTIFTDGVSAFRQATFSFEITLDPERLDPEGNRNPEEMARVTTIGYSRVLDEALVSYLAANGISTEGVSEKEIAAFISRDTPARLRDMVLADPSIVGQTIRFEGYATGRIDGYLKGRVTR
jgi:phosphate transport system permease protein